MSSDEATWTAWIARSRPLDGFTCEAMFSVAETLLTGLPSEPVIPLELPAINGAMPGWLTTQEVLGQEEALAAYYRRLIDTALAHGWEGSLRQPFPHFAVGPKILAADGEELAGFSWTDDVPETATVLAALAGAAGAPAGLIHGGADQGWEILVERSGDRVCFVEWDSEGPPPIGGGWSMNAREVAGQAAAALARLNTIHARLVAALGHDHWTYFRWWDVPRRRSIFARVTDTLLGRRRP